MNSLERNLITLTGVVQGVGFRPFVFREAARLQLNGRVENCGSKVLIDAEGHPLQLQKFIRTLKQSPPPNAYVATMEVHPLSLTGYTDFIISPSGAQDNTASFTGTDIAVCSSCTEEFFNPEDRRYRYPFISCTHCGPRYSIINRLPYDRESTSMLPFPLCESCGQEYKNPIDRRFHAQTNCCVQCGPYLQLLNAQGVPQQTDVPDEEARQHIAQGKILAVKGIGGYHLCCDAKNPAAVKTLRQRKSRPHKPLAIMARNLSVAEKICTISEAESALLTGSRKPILLLNKRFPEGLAETVAPDNKRLGVMLPYAPLHFLLFPEGIDYLVMTSGNISGSPVCYRDSDALSALADIADYFLIHNREIVVPVDDAVAKLVCGQEALVRCGRGYAPVTLPVDYPYRMLAVGAQQKCSVCITGDGYAAVSQYIGDLSNHKTYTAFLRQVEHFKALFNGTPDIFVRDLNADYLSSDYAQKHTGKIVTIQHHHAHMAGCMAENGLSQPVIGIICDGTGLGYDGAVWGGEIFTGTPSGFERVGHLKYVVLQGAESTVKEPWRSAACYLFDLGVDPGAFLPGVSSAALKMVYAALQSDINCCASSSMGRLFDCVAALCGFQSAITYDAQAAVTLENMADVQVTSQYDYSISEIDEMLILDYSDMLKGVLDDLLKNTEKPVIATRFHNTVISALAESAEIIKRRTALKSVVLSGGVFENSYLLNGLANRLKHMGFAVYFNRLTPANDGGIAFGQAAAAGAILKEKGYVSCNSGKDCKD